MTFFDTSYLFALFNPRDPWHDAAQSCSNQSNPPFLTTDYIILELGNILVKPEWRAQFDRVLEVLTDNPEVTVVEQDRPLFNRGIQLFRDRPDKAWSLVDCISFLVMRDHQCTVALTSDAHFAQAGFKTPMRDLMSS